MHPIRLLLLCGLAASALPAAPDPVFLYNGPGGGLADYVAANTPLEGGLHYSLDPGAGFTMPFDPGLPRSPSAGYSGPVFYAGFRLLNTSPSSRVTASAEQTQRVANNRADDLIQFQVATESALGPVTGRYIVALVFPVSLPLADRGAVVEYLRSKGQKPGGDHIRVLAGDGQRWFVTDGESEITDTGGPGRLALPSLAGATWRSVDLRSFGLGLRATCSPSDFRYLGFYFEGGFEAARGNGLVESFGLLSFSCPPASPAP